MKAVGVIAEYNPFHNGHQYHIEKAKSITGSDYAVVVMSGDFVQRGEPAIVNKYARTRMALQGGADLVLELPVRYAAGSAEYFASGAVSLLHHLGIIDFLCFGSECGDIHSIEKIGRILSEETPEFSALIRSFTSQGMLYPAAREKALLSCCKNLPDCDTDVLTSPNNILGIEYCKALYRLKSTIKPVTITRKGAGYHQQELSEEFSSASAIRSQITDGNWSDLAAHIPPESWSVLNGILQHDGFVDLNDFTSLLKYKLMSETADSLTSYQDVSPDLAHKILSQFEKADSYSGLVEMLKTKDVAYTRISRALLHILLNVKKISCDTGITVPYARILGFKKNSSEMLKEMKRVGKIPLVSKLADRGKILSGDALNMIDEDIWCANLYEMVKTQKAGTEFIHELRQQVVVE